MMVNDLRNTLLIGLTVLALASAAWWLDPQRSAADQQGAGATAVTRPAEPDSQAPSTQPSTQPGTQPDTAATRPAPRPPSLRHRLGINAAHIRLGKQTPTGVGITVGHVEFGQGQYLPNTTAPVFKGVTFVKRSGVSKVSGHAFATARVIYGRQGFAPGVNVVHCFESRDWMGKGYLGADTDRPPVGGPMRVLTHSWVSDAPYAAEVLRRADWQVDTHDTVICVGVNNGRHSPVPYLLGTAYNVITVGTPYQGGESSGGYTRIETPGRCKPDIVGLGGLTSFTTPAVAAIAARLLQGADEMTDHAHRAGRAEVIKAVLLTGAVKPPNWQPAPGRPLDEHLGAGVVHFDQSLQVLQAGPADPGRLPKRMGWDFRAIQPDQTLAYTFATAAEMGETSIVLTWHRRITALADAESSVPAGRWVGLSRTTDLNLRLIHIDDAGEEHDLAVSQSRVDNVEHIYLKQLPPGRYRLEVSRSDAVYDEPWDYALAWRVELLEDSAP